MINNKRIILIADDKEFIRDMFEAYIDTTLPGYSGEYINNGKDFEARLKRNLDGVVLAIIDNNMPPGKKGIDIIREYASRVKFRFALHTGDWTRDELGEEAQKIREEVQKLGAIYLPKPCDYSKLPELVRSVARG